MFRIGKIVLNVLLLVFVAAAPLACINIDRSPDDRHKEVNVGGEHGVTVDRRSDNPPGDEHKTEVNVGGERGVTVDHPSDK